jgi:hypothetical protein
MKLPIILFATAFVVVLLNAEFAESKTAGAKGAGPATPASTSTSQAMYQCEARYAGPRGFLGRDRYAYIEACFKALTGMYPAQARENCTLRRC